MDGHNSVLACGKCDDAFWFSSFHPDLIQACVRFNLYSPVFLTSSHLYFSLELHLVVFFPFIFFSVRDKAAEVLPVVHYAYYEWSR